MSDDGSEPLLSGEETDALLDAMRQSAGSAPEKAVEGLDLVSSEPRLRSALSASDLAVRYLQVVGSSNEPRHRDDPPRNPHRWIRYMTKSSSYVVRI